MNLLGGAPEQAERGRQTRLGLEPGLAIETPGPGVSAWYPDIQPNNKSFRRENQRSARPTPGYAEPNPVCGSVRFKVLCPEVPKHFSRENRYSCHRPECPTCWPSWAARAAGRACDTIEGYRAASGINRKPRHVSLSPDPTNVPYEGPGPEALQWLYDEGRRVVAVLGISAAAVIAHPYRIVPEYEAAVSRMADNAGENRYTWALSQENWRDLVYFSPHLHLLAYGPLMDSDKFHDVTEWIYVNHDDDESGDTGRSGDELKKTVFYLLSHSWVRGNNATVRYWLGMSTRRLKCSDSMTLKKPVFCPVCGVQAVRVQPDIIRADGSVYHEYQDLRNAPKAYRKIFSRVYELRPVKPRPVR